ncbi:MAG: hypothetical protein H6624_00755 [Bdellovibrionaceae bacterium]|nr:hypothetical protein [Bdellovibrionales bacterium]MCB9082838.1 hypothetical protein [Pseudobdellovibrionaceae bacterium]
MKVRESLNLHLWAIALISTGLWSCSTVTMTVNSVPEKAKVFVRPVGAGEAVEVGVTPVVLTQEQLKTADADSGPVIVEVRKDDFKTESVLVTEAAAVDMKLDFALQLVDSEQGQAKGPGNTLADAQSLNIAIDRLFEVRKFISLESYGEALNHLRYIEEKWPYLSSAYELKGGILFLQKKYRDALAAYALSLKYNPKSVPSAQMRDTLEKKLNIDGDELARQYELERAPAATDEGDDEKGSVDGKSKKKRPSKKTKKKRRRKPKKKAK